MRLDASRWFPEQRGTGLKSSEDLLPGTLIIYDRKPYRVADIRPRPHDLWPAAYRDAWVEQGMPDPATWHGRPVVLVVTPEGHGDGKRLHMLAPAIHSWKTLPEHFSICRLCHELPPCSHVHNEAVMAEATVKLNQEMAIMPGVCHGCRGPITARQKTIRFEGENLIRPDLGNDTAIFHAKQSCHWAAEEYDKKWAQAVPGRRRKLFCEGRGRHHYDGSFDCTEPGCPGQVRHRTEERHSPGTGILTSGCWCVSGDLTERIEQQMRDGEVKP